MIHELKLKQVQLEKHQLLVVVVIQQNPLIDNYRHRQVVEKIQNRKMILQLKDHRKIKNHHRHLLRNDVILHHRRVRQVQQKRRN